MSTLMRKPQPKFYEELEKRGQEAYVAKLAEFLNKPLSYAPEKLEEPTDDR